MVTESDGRTTVDGSLRVVDGAGVVRLERRYATSAHDLWSALTDPTRLVRWYGQVSGDLREGGAIHVRIDGPDIDADGRITVCTPPTRLQVQTRETDVSAGRGDSPPFDQTVDATLTPDADDTVLVIEIRGLPVDKLSAFGVGWHLHTESLDNYLRDVPAPDIPTRWSELSGHYDALAASL